MMNSAEAFIDTNVWLYAFIKGQDLEKTRQAIDLINSTSRIILSTQVVNEVCVNLLQKQKMSEEEVRDTIDDFYTLYEVIEVGQEHFISASRLRERYALSYWDSLIVAAAIASGTSIMYSEDMQDGLHIEKRLIIVNPFQ